MKNSLFPLLGGLFLVAPSLLSAQPVPAKGMTQEVWENVHGNTVDKLTESGRYKKGSASSARIIKALDTGELGDQYGSRYSALLLPPETGEYTFRLAADDTAELSLSLDDSPENLVKIAFLDSYTSPRGFGKRGASSPIRLEKGKRYYLQLLHKEGSGGDHVALSWEGPGIKKGILTEEYTIPVVEGNTLKVLEKTAAQDTRKAELFDGLLKLEPRDVPEFLEKQAPGDLSLLAGLLSEQQKKGESLAPGERKKAWEPLVRLASHLAADAGKPLKNPAGKALLSLESAWIHALSPEELKQLGPHRLAPSLGEIPENAAPVNITTSLFSKGDKHRSELVSTGAYALPGVPFTVTLPEGTSPEGITVQVGHHIDPGDKAELVSLPRTTLRFPMKERTQTFSSPHGGIILLDVPEKTDLPNVPAQFDRVLPAPRFVLGQTTDEQWKTLRNNPAPWGELISEHLTLLMPSDVLKACDNPSEVMAWWNENNRRHEDFYGYYPGVPFRMHAALYAREGISYWPLEWQVKNAPNLLDMKYLTSRNDALYLHEHGHHADFGDMEFGYSSESTCNWAGYYMKSQTSFDWKDSPNTHMLKLLNPEDKQHNEIKQPGWYSISTKGTHHWSYPITSMMLGYTEDFGWEPFKKVIHRLRDKSDAMYSWPFTQKKHDDQAKIDRYLIGLSEEAKRDVRPYFAHFQMLPSPGAAEYLDKLALPRWDLSHLPTPAVTETQAGKALTIPQPEKTLLSMAGDSTLKWGAPENGTLSTDGDGNAVYTPKPGFTGTDRLPYTLKNKVGESPVKYLPIKVTPAL